jgi:hypothetical protein
LAERTWQRWCVETGQFPAELDAVNQSHESHLTRIKG